MAAFRANRQHFRRVKGQMVMAVFAHQVAKAHYLAAVINTVMVEILEHFAPLQLGFIGNIRQLLPDTLFDYPEKDAVCQFFLAFLNSCGRTLPDRVAPRG